VDGVQGLLAKLAAPEAHTPSHGPAPTSWQHIEALGSLCAAQGVKPLLPVFEIESASAKAVLHDDEGASKL